MDRQIAELIEAREEMKLTIKEWDRRLASTPEGSPAHLLESIRSRVS